MDLPRLTPQPGVPYPHRRILLIDDNDDARDLMGIALEMHGHRVAMAGNGADGLALARAFRPDVIFLDLGMPVMDGFETALELRRLDGLEAVWILALSGWNDQATLARARKAGFDFHLTKPANFNQIDNFLYGDWKQLARASLRGPTSPL
jgi:CheY-like chemotaxis protein